MCVFEEGVESQLSAGWLQGPFIKYMVGFMAPGVK